MPEIRPVQKQSPSVLIFGAGISGMAASLELHKADIPFVVVEKNDKIGGLCRTLQWGEFRTDIGPHIVKQGNTFIQDLLGKRVIAATDLTRLCYNGKIIHFFAVKEILSKVGPRILSKVLIDYSAERVKIRVQNRVPFSLEEKLASDFGRTLAELFLLDYVEKVWGLPCAAMSPDLISRMPPPLKDVLRSFIKLKNFAQTFPARSGITRHCYPDDGIGLICNKMEEALNHLSDNIKLEAYPEEILHNGKSITEVKIRSGRESIAYTPTHVISSIPITAMLNLLQPKPPRDILEAADSLKFRSHVSLLVTLNKTSVLPDVGVYFPEKRIPFGRMTEPKKFSKQLSPLDKTSLLLEFFCWENDQIWNASKAELYELSVEWLERLGLISRDEVIDYFIHKEKDVYPVYDLDYRIHLRVVADYLRHFDNLQLIGSAGSFKYTEMANALTMGTSAAGNIINVRQ